MKTRARKFLCIFLTLFMLMPLLLAFSAAADDPDPTVGANEEPETGYFKAYADAEDGELLYKADFKGDAHWAPSTEAAKENAGWHWNTQEKVLTATVDPEDSGKADFTLEEKGNTAWGGDLTDFPLEPGYSYTFLFSVTKDTPIGLLIDGHYGGYFLNTKASVRKNGGNLSGHSAVSYGKNVPTRTDTQEYAITVENVRYEDDEVEAGAEQTTTKMYTFTLFVKDNDGHWIKIDSGEPVNKETRDTIGLYFYAYNPTDVTVSNVEVYKGITAAVYVPEEDDPTGENGENGTPQDQEEVTTAKQKDTYGAPKLVETTAAPAAAEQPAKKGCKSAIGANSAWLLLIASVGTTLAILTVRGKKKEND